LAARGGFVLDLFLRLCATELIARSYTFGSLAVIQSPGVPDLLLCLSYLLVAAGVWHFLKSRPALAFSWLYLLFVAFVLSCGLTQLLASWLSWYPLHVLEGAVKLITAAGSLPMAFLFVRGLPDTNSAPDPQVLLAEIVESSDDAIISKDLNGKITSWNAGADRIYGYSREEAIGQPIGLLAVPDRSNEMPDILAEVAKGKRISHYETSRRRKDGKLIDVSLTISPVQNARGKVIGISAISRDITERKQAEERSSRQAALLDQSHDAIIVRTLDGVITYWSSGAERLYGFWRSDAIGQINHKFLRTSHPLGIRHLSETLIRDGRWTGELEHVTLDGRTIVVESDQVVLKEAGTDRTLILETNRDITEKKAAEESLARLNDQVRQSEDRFRTLAEAVPVLLWTSLPNGNLSYVSSSFQQYTGMPGDSDLDDIWNRSIHPEDTERVSQLWNQSVESGEPYRAEFRLRRRDGTFRWFVAQALPMPLLDGSIQQWLGSCADVDDLKRTETALVRTNNELRQFAYAAAHDLQEPLRNVALSLSMLRRMHSDLLEAEAQEWVSCSIEGAQRMQLMVKDLLEYSRVVDSEVRSEAASDSATALALALANLKTTIAETGTRVTAGNLPVVQVEEIHLLQLFQNLIGNSIKYRKHAVQPQVRIEAQRQNGDWVFSISDNGIGFDPAYAEQIFGVFKRLHTRAEFPGNGIGLSLCARIVAHYGGRIWAEGETGRGAIFRFSLPATEEVNA
jgi:PAS domain S-box-containing protein